MQALIRWSGHAAAVAGILCCVVAVLARVGGAYYIANVEAMTVFNLGVGLMVFACLARLELLLQQH